MPNFLSSFGRGVGSGLGGGTTGITVPQLIMPTPAAKPTPAPASTGDALTLDALMKRQEDIAASQQMAMKQPVASNEQGFAQMAWALVNGLKQRKAEREMAAGQQEIANAFQTGMDPNTGTMSQDAIAAVARRDPELATKMALEAAQARREAAAAAAAREQTLADREAGYVHEGLVNARELQEDLDKEKRAAAAAAAGQEHWTDIPTPEGETGQWQQNSISGEKQRKGGAGQNITIGTGEKLTESLVKDTSYYPGARAANLELDDLDTTLTSGPEALKNLLPGSAYWNSPEYKQARVAGDSWIMNVLRRESGATIKEDELAANRATYLPQPGDDAATIAYKKRLREEKTNTLRYGLEAAAPETLAKIDAAYEAQKAARAERRKAAAGGVTPPAGPVGPGPAGTTPPAATPPAAAAATPPPRPAWAGTGDPWPTPEQWGRMTPEQQRQFLTWGQSPQRPGDY